MAGKFKMSNGTEGMLKGQAPRDAFEAAGYGKRSYRTDTVDERAPIKPTKQHAESTGFVSQCTDLATDSILEKAITDRYMKSFMDGCADGENARLEEEREERAQQVSAEQLDNLQDARNVDDDDLEAVRARRREQMKAAHEKKMKYQALGHGSYDQITEEEFLKTVTASERCVVHFFHKNFEKCKIMDMHLSKCARFFFGTRFVKLDAEKAPFFVEKLKIKTLPAAIVFSDNGVAKGRQLGFDGLGGEEFQTGQLAWRLKEFGGIEEDFGPEDEIS